MSTIVATNDSTQAAVILKVTPTLTETIYIYRRDSRGVAVVRATGQGYPVVNGVRSDIPDYEAKQGDRAAYFLANSAGVTLDTAYSTPPAWGSWVKSPGRPALNVRVALNDDGDEKLDANREVVYVEGSGVPVVLTGPRRASTGSVVLAVRTGAEMAAVRALLNDGGTLYLDTAAEWLLPWSYVQVGAVTVSRVFSELGLDKTWRLVTLGELISVSTPLDPLQVNVTATYDALPVKYATYAAMAATTSTYNLLATR